MASRFERAVDAQGRLNDAAVTRRKSLYTGRNGKKVERFQLSDTSEDGRSYIFKPLTNPDTFGRDAWAYKHLLPLVPVRVPRLLAQAEHADAERFWAIYEDLGELRHSFAADVLAAAVEAIALWHRLPLETLPTSRDGHTPPVDRITDMLRRDLDRLRHAWREAGLTAEPLRRFEDVLEGGQAEGDKAEGGQADDNRSRLSSGWEWPFPAETVVAHGDYNPFNVAVRDGELIVLDWEYAHRNAVYWDLYNQLDITSPRYRRPPLQADTRHRLLRHYTDARRQLQPGYVPPDDFAGRYHRFALLYSAWILTLIDGDLQRKDGPYEREELLAQREETAAVIRDATPYL